MRRLLLTLATLFFGISVISQTVQRSVVIMEIGTGTGCQYCPGAAMGAHDLLTNGQQVAVIEYHNYNPSSDPFYNPAAAVRCGYYGISGYPTTFFDGTVNYVGGSNTTSMYPQYLPLYNQQYSVPAPVTVSISGTNIGDNYNITMTITKLASVTGTNLRAYLVLTESGIPYSWQGQNEINDTERLMVPDGNGTPISFTSGNTVTLNLSFTKDPSWITANCELIGFLQDFTTKTIYNGTKVALNNLYLPLPTNFTATPTSGCTPLTVNYTDQSTGATQWNWSFPGGTPSTSTLQNPVVVYNTPGTYDVTLNAGNPAGNQYGALSKSAYISTSTTPLAPTTPSGNNALCIDPPDQTYSTTAVANSTGYTWELLPSTAGVLTPNGTTCVVNWDNTFTGIAQLKARAYNGCGNSPWTAFLNITISTQPGQAGTPTGPTALCMNAGTSNYTTTGATNAMSYTWELLPADAGALYPSGTSLSVQWTATFTGTAVLKVKGINNSCEGIWSNPLSIVVSPGPTAYNVTGGGVYCAIGGSGKQVDLSGSQTGTSYTLYRDNVATSSVVPGTGNAISFGNQTLAGAYTVKASTTSGNCTNNMNGNAVISIDPQAPLTPGTPSGPAQVYTGSTPLTDYTTNGGSYATSYTWEISPVSAGTIAGNTVTGKVTWNQSYVGSANIKVQGVNSCGNGTFSAEFAVNVDMGVGIADPASAGMFRIFPNPAKSEIFITSPKRINAAVSIFNSLGNTVMENAGIVISDKYPVNISNLTPGLYFVKIQSAAGQEIIKLMVE